MRLASNEIKLFEGESGTVFYASQSFSWMDSFLMAKEIGVHGENHWTLVSNISTSSH